MLGLPVRAPHEAKAIVAQAREKEGILLNAAGENTLRFVPPLVISAEEIDRGLAGLRRATRATFG
jgi:acetylornithine/succinyldiaminopimelate/putrescine aminotransferase